MADKRTVFITGTTGSMGGAGFRELLRRRDRFDIVTLVRSLEEEQEAHGPVSQRAGGEDRLGRFDPV